MPMRPRSGKDVVCCPVGGHVARLLDARAGAYREARDVEKAMRGRSSLLK